MADDTITRGSIRGLGSPLYICGNIHTNLINARAIKVQCHMASAANVILLLLPLRPNNPRNKFYKSGFTTLKLAWTIIHPIHRFKSSDWLKKKDHLTWIIFNDVHVCYPCVLFFTISLTLKETVIVAAAASVVSAELILLSLLAAEFGTQ